MECVYTVHTVHTALRMCTCAVPVCYIGLEQPIGEAWYSTLQYITASVCNIGLEQPIEQKVEAPRWPIFKFQSQHPPACQENNIHCTAIQNTLLGFNDLGESTVLSSVNVSTFFLGEILVVFCIWSTGQDKCEGGRQDKYKGGESEEGVT